MVVRGKKKTGDGVLQRGLPSFPRGENGNRALNAKETAEAFQRGFKSRQERFGKEGKGGEEQEEEKVRGKGRMLS